MSDVWSMLMAIVAVALPLVLAWWLLDFADRKQTPTRTTRVSRKQ